jgi:hypothetical protein
MRTRHVDGVEVHRGSGNMLADLDLANAEKLKIKTGLVVEIRRSMRSQSVTQQEDDGHHPAQSIQHDARQLQQLFLAS